MLKRRNKSYGMYILSKDTFKKKTIRISGSRPSSRSLYHSVVVQSLSYVRLFAACQASLSFTISPNLLKLMSVMPSNHLILCRPLLLISIFPSIRVFSSELALHIRWPKYWSISFGISPSNEHSGLISFRTDWFDLPAIVV